MRNKKMMDSGNTRESLSLALNPAGTFVIPRVTCISRKRSIHLSPVKIFPRENK